VKSLQVVAISAQQLGKSHLGFDFVMEVAIAAVDKFVNRRTNLSVPNVVEVEGTDVLISAQLAAVLAESPDLVVFNILLLPPFRRQNGRLLRVFRLGYQSVHNPTPPRCEPNFLRCSWLLYG